MFTLILMSFGCLSRLSESQSLLYNECTGTDINCHTVGSVLRCDSGYQSGCISPLTNDCNQNCIFTVNGRSGSYPRLVQDAYYNSDTHHHLPSLPELEETKEGSSNTGLLRLLPGLEETKEESSNTGLLRLLPELEETKEESSNNGNSLLRLLPELEETKEGSSNTADWRLPIITLISAGTVSYGECIGTDTNCHTIDGVLRCDSGYNSFCWSSEESNCDYECISGYHECIGADTNCHSIDRVFKCDAGYYSQCGSSLSSHCASKCVAYQECTGTDINCHTDITDNVLKCDAGYKSSCTLPLTAACNQNCDLISSNGNENTPLARGGWWCDLCGCC